MANPTERQNHMKIITQTKAFTKALAFMNKVAMPRTPKPILTCARLVADRERGTLTISATDLEVWCHWTISAVQVEEGGEAVLPIAKLLTIARQCGGDQSLELVSAEPEQGKAQDWRCSIRGAGSEFSVLGYDPADFPGAADFAEDGRFTVPADMLAQMIERTLFAAAMVHSHYAMSSTLWEAKANGKRFTMTATDGHRLAQAAAYRQAGGVAVNILAPQKFMSLSLALAKRADGDLEVSVTNERIFIRQAADGHKVHCGFWQAGDTVVLGSALCQGNFPHYKDLIPRGESIKTKLTVNRAQLACALEKVLTMTDECSRGVRLSFQDGQITMAARTAESGEAKATCPAKVEGDRQDIGFNPQLLLEPLRAIDIDEIVLELQAPNKPAKLTAGNDYLYIVMPVDLSQ